MPVHRILYFLPLVALLASCGNNQQHTTLFSLIPASATGISFQNKVTDTDTLNILDYLYYYNGGGVAIADFNKDGLPDIYFTANLASNRLYLNQGNFHFSDVTDAAGVNGKGNWKTGATICDVNADGWPDIYVSEVGGYKNLHGHNELFINNGPASTGAGQGLVTFTEKSHAYGLDVEGFNTQAIFFDYDNDGDLDMFLVNHSVHSNESYGNASIRMIKDDKSGDKLFRNDNGPGGRHFTEVTREAGIYSSIIGYGLSVSVGDLNNDGWPDIYVSNDFHENDYYYLNNRNGSFTEINRDAFGHESRFSMGSAIADMNNDGWQDIITLDMLPADENILKSSAGDDPLDIYNFKFGFGYYHQYSRNCLQLNTGGGRRFSDIALYSGIAATDWSWSPLAADFDNDGVKDVFVTNGIVRRPNDLDFIKYYSAGAGAGKWQNDRDIISKMPPGKVKNYMFRGTDSLKFTDVTDSWGFSDPTVSTGAAYADLDNDGDLDLVINNINEPASVYRNNTTQQSNHRSLDVRLSGDSLNPLAIGASVTILNRGLLQTDYLSAGKGFESASLQYLHFGTGTDTTVGLLQVKWPGGKTQTLSNVHTGTRLTLTCRDAVPGEKLLLPTALSDTSNELFTDITQKIGLPYKHRENDFTDFNQQAFIPHLVSTQGPKIVVSDIDNDGLDDFFVCGAKGQPGTLFRQSPDGRFKPIDEKLFAQDAGCEDVNAIFFDADGDGNKDLMVVSGGNETESADASQLDRLYLNDGKGSFIKSTGLPVIYGNKSVVTAADVDHDGDLDLFLGGRVVAGHYGLMPPSYLLINDGHAHFTIAPDSFAQGLGKMGLVTDAAWTDLNRDGWPDLVIAGEWMPITIFINEQGKLVNRTSMFGLGQATGLWSTLLVTDINNDGWPDILAGNWGENSKLTASTSFPLLLYDEELDHNASSPDQLLAVAKNGQYYPFLPKEELEKQLPALLRKKYSTYAAMAGKTMDEIFGDQIKHAHPLQAAVLSSVALVNVKGESFAMTKLPFPAQWSPIFAFLAGDFNSDGKTDVLSAGNFYGVLPYEGRYDAGNGTTLLNNGNRFTALSPMQSGFRAPGEIRDIKAIRLPGAKKAMVVAQNNGPLLFYKFR